MRRLVWLKNVQCAAHQLKKIIVVDASPVRVSDKSKTTTLL